jgi:hypothetical protein
MLLAAWLHAGAGAGPAEAVARLRLAQLDAARKTCELGISDYRDGVLLSPEYAYRWSCRWLEAERALKPQKAEQVPAYEKHLERMRSIANITNDRWRRRIITLAEVNAAEYYAVEAELWLIEAKSK